MSLSEVVNDLVTQVFKGMPVSEEDTAEIARRVAEGQNTAGSLKHLNATERKYAPVSQDMMIELNKIRVALTKKGGRRKTRRRRRTVRRRNY
jgi:hypothetical protein